MYYFDPNGLPLEKGTPVIIETQTGTEYGTCVTGLFEAEDERIVPPLRKVLRIVGENDEKTLRAIARKAEDAIAVCRERVEKHGLDMKVVDVEYTFDGNKITFYFTSDGRVDFRELVKDLASVFRTRIELRQIGVRDEARMLGGLGVCGKQFCCSTFLDEFQPVSIKMAKEQSLSLNPTKISGTCGRLMCCLKYEQAAYEHLHSVTPRVDSVVQTPQGPGTVTEVSLLRGNIKVRLDASPDTPVKTMHRTDVKVIRHGRARAESREDPPEET
jgi:cell fate regulator YaaT (PSP1 superfamily)